MSRPGVAMLVWAAMLGVLGGVLWAVFVEVDLLSVLMPAFAIGGTVAIAAISSARARRRAPRDVLVGEPSPDLSWSSVLVAIGVSVALVGLEVGTFLVFIGAGLALLGVGGLVREWRAERRAVR